MRRKEVSERLVLAIIIILIVFCKFPILPSVEGRSSVSAIFILGDSTVNCGDNTFLFPFLRKNSTSSYICSSDGPRLIPDLLAEKMGLGAVPSFYGQNGTLEGVLGGLNYGSSPATIINSGVSGFHGLNQQLRQAFETLQLLQLELGYERAREVVASSVFYLSFGKDDFIELYLTDFYGVKRKYGPRRFARILANQMTRVAKDIYNANVRKIIFLGVGPLGCAPRALWESYNATAGTGGYCSNEINEMVIQYNTILSANLIHLNLKLPDARFIFCDVYLGMMDIISQPQIYGFKNVDTACCGAGRYGGAVGCFSKAIACGEGSNSSYVWWDLYNPTEHVNSLLADWMWSATHLNLCHPITIQQLASTSAMLNVSMPRQP